ncbi:MAG: SDR family oxidoreductase [Amaricoccus sp.]|uniref:NAD-dependent epimerase/dehydratase family protein n=1 Tax=Amaricoccus sp. TaxID=1872485 RepID=UPI0039E2AACD
MHVLLTGAGGIVGRFVAPALAAAGHRVTRLGRSGDVPWNLDDPAPRLPPADALVHLAFDHVPGRYRGGEGDDPARFRRLNLDGSRRLFDAVGAARIVFLSSRAVYGDQRRDQFLKESDPATPDSLYGEVKLAAEQALAGRGASLRATGVYGGAAPHKWSDLFAAYLAGDPVAPRIATEIHGDDVARAVVHLLASPETGAFNASDLLLDRHDLLARVRALTGSPHPPPPPATGPRPGVMATCRLRLTGWRPGGWSRLDTWLREVVPAGE